MNDENKTSTNVILRTVFAGILAGFVGNVTAHDESSQVNQIMFAKESDHDFWLN